MYLNHSHFVHEKNIVANVFLNFKFQDVRTYFMCMIKLHKIRKKPDLNSIIFFIVYAFYAELDF